MTSAIDRYRVLAAGVFSIMLTLGVARFAYTPLLPLMQQQAGLGVGEAGWLASINYVGYLCGALAASLISDLVLKDRLYRIGMVAGVATTAMMGVSQDPCGLGGFPLLGRAQRFRRHAVRHGADPQLAHSPRAPQ